MRLTKATLQRALADAAQFNQMPIKVLAAHAAVPAWRIGDYFLPVCQYGRGMLPLHREIGTNGHFRCILKAPK